ncbi:ABC transporter permease [Pseudonocardia oroxyli]|uniref:Peptide/nickel transport system permease protein/nickel transport system permease protein n=1 Tax=Pseudonocardia oroxyli TaxID=366584 RepID=A0A1G7XVE1_PSEOR|nr:ABC transporter permease [Pseudonocardia oroxyli]SDG88121.1 peptide/nickel transport system permease protein/nickel transport system permease protein [Pseudonocardia oroxyli]
MLVLRRLGQALVTLAGAGVLVFAMLAATPGDPARRVLEARGVTEPGPPAVAAVRAELGLDDPLLVRFGSWAADAARGDLGTSWRTGRPVSDEFAARLPATLRLTTAALALAVTAALLLGATAALGAGRWPDVLARGIALAVLVVPGFVVGIVVLDLVVVRAGLGRVIADGTWATVFLPALTLALGSIATWSRVLRTSLLEAGSAAHLRVSAARGASPRRRLLVHQLPHAAAPFLTMVGLGTAALIGGAPIVESVFTWPGIGRYTVEAINARDMPVVVGFTLVAVLTYVLAGLVVDLLCAAVDPRLRA